MSHITSEDFYEAAQDALEDIAESNLGEKRSVTAWVKLLLEKVQSNLDESGDDDYDDDELPTDDDLPDDEG